METFGDKLETIRSISDSASDLGDRFERLFMQLALTEAEFGVRRIWKWEEWPDRVERAGLSAKDTGIDLVAESVTGDLAAIQCKCYDEDRRLGKGDLDSFFAFSGFTDRSADEMRAVFETQWVVSTCQWTRNLNDFVKAQGHRLKRVDFRQYSDIEYPDSDSAVRRIKNPFDFQLDAIRNCVGGLFHNGHSRGRLVMACGTGKTFVSLKIAEEITRLSGNRLVLFLAPSIALVSQARREWLECTQNGILPLVVCSDNEAGGRKEDISLTELRCKVTTDASAINEFMQQSSELMKVIFCTYQSLRRVVDAQVSFDSPEFSLTVADEAHRTTGLIGTEEDPSKVNFQLVHDGAKLRSERRLYMTATPRVYDATSTKRAQQRDYEVVDMSNHTEQYGPEMYRIGFGEAVTHNRLSEYRVIVLGVSTSDVTARLKDAVRNIKWEGTAKSVKPTEKELVRVLGTALAVNGTYELEGEKAVPLRKVLAYANTIPRSKWYREVLGMSQIKSLTTRRIGKASALKLRATHVDASASAGERTQVLRELDQANVNGETYIVNNVKLFTEGVDIPSLDAVVFLDPRDSQVDVVQAVGRVMRKAEGKKFGHIVIPVILGEDEDWLTALESNSEGYKTIGKVLRALQAHDSRLAEEPETFIHVLDARKGSTSGGGGSEEDEGSEQTREPNLFDSLEEVEPYIFAKVVATSKLGKPGKIVADQISEAVKYAASSLKRGGSIPVIAQQLDFSIDPKQDDSDQHSIAIIAALLLCNACLMHKRLKSTVPQMGALTSLDKLNIATEPIGQIMDTWSTILEFDYVPVFAPAIAILKALRQHGFTDNQTHAAIRPLIECANQVADSLSDLGYDHAGPLYHQILPSGRSDGAYYTNNLSALMLARLALPRDFMDWRDIDAIEQLRIMDPACGTGTLLMAICKTLKDRVKEANGATDELALHKSIVENILCGLDINHHAVQLAGCNLTLGAPTVDYDRINVAKVKHGTRHTSTGEMQLGSLELLDMDRSESELQGIAHDFATLDELGAESAGGGGDSPSLVTI